MYVGEGARRLSTRSLARGPAASCTRANAIAPRLLARAATSMLGDTSPSPSSRAKRGPGRDELESRDEGRKGVQLSRERRGRAPHLRVDLANRKGEVVSRLLLPEPVPGTVKGEVQRGRGRPQDARLAAPTRCPCVVARRVIHASPGDTPNPGSVSWRSTSAPSVERIQ